jgi:hypothetical protein
MEHQAMGVKTGIYLFRGGRIASRQVYRCGPRRMPRESSQLRGRGMAISAACPFCSDTADGTRRGGKLLSLEAVTGGSWLAPVS